MTKGVGAPGAGGAQHDGSEPVGGQLDQDQCPWMIDGRLAVPWIVIYGRGVASEDLAVKIVSECRKHGVYATLCPVDEYSPSAGLQMMGLVVVPPVGVTGKDATQTWKVIKEIVDEYRRVRISASDGLTPDPLRCSRVGVFQIFHEAESLDDPIAEGIIRIADARHPFIPGEALKADLFAIVQPGATLLAAELDSLIDAEDANLRQLRRWGIESITFAVDIKKAIDDYRFRLNSDSAKPVLSRPIPDREISRLDLLLFKPDVVPPIDPNESEEERKKTLEKFRDNGARVVRVLVKELEEKYPPFHRPASIQNKKNAQVAFVTMYNVLRVVTMRSHLSQS